MIKYLGTATIVLTCFIGINRGQATDFDKVSYQSILGLSDEITIQNIEFVKIGKMDGPRTISNPTVVELNIMAYTGCDQVVVKNNGPTRLVFLEIKRLGASAQPSCAKNIQYYLAPTDPLLPVGSSETMTVEIGTGKSSVRFEVSVQVAKVANANGFGSHYEYSDVKIREVDQ